MHNLTEERIVASYCNYFVLFYGLGETTILWVIGQQHQIVLQSRVTVCNLQNKLCTTEQFQIWLDGRIIMIGFEGNCVKRVVNFYTFVDISMFIIVICFRNFEHDYQ